VSGLACRNSLFDGRPRHLKPKRSQRRVRVDSEPRGAHYESPLERRDSIGKTDHWPGPKRGANRTGRPRLPRSYRNRPRCKILCEDDLSPGRLDVSCRTLKKACSTFDAAQWRVCSPFSRGRSCGNSAVGRNDAAGQICRPLPPRTPSAVRRTPHAVRHTPSAVRHAPRPAPRCLQPAGGSDRLVESRAVEITIGESAFWRELPCSVPTSESCWPGRLPRRL